MFASKIPAPCIQERTGVIPVGSGSSFMVRAPRGRLSCRENMKVSVLETFFFSFCSSNSGGKNQEKDEE